MEIDVRYVAELARLALSDDEAELFQGQLSRVLGYIEQLNGVDVSGVEPMAHANPVYNVFRADEEGQSTDKEAMLANAPHAVNGLFVVTKVIE